MIYMCVVWRGRGLASGHTNKWGGEGGARQIPGVDAAVGMIEYDY